MTFGKSRPLGRYTPRTLGARHPRGGCERAVGVHRERPACECADAGLGGQNLGKRAQNGNSSKRWQSKAIQGGWQGAINGRSGDLTDTGTDGRGTRSRLLARQGAARSGSCLSLTRLAVLRHQGVVTLGKWPPRLRPLSPQLQGLLSLRFTHGLSTGWI